MGKTWEPGICNEKAGFLFRHACLQLPTGSCQSCGKPICEKHSRLFDDANLCIDCARHYRDQSRGHYDGYHDPYFYGGYYYHGYNDYSGDHWGGETFQQQTTVERPLHDVNDFTEADSESLLESVGEETANDEVDEGFEGEDFESDMSES